MRRAILVVILGAAVLAGAACERSRPVARLSLQASTVNLGYPLVAQLGFRWTPTAALDGLEGKPLVFVHVLDGGRRLLRTFDHPLPEVWTPGRPQSYEIELYQSAIGEPLPPGAYEVTGGLYEHGTRKRWPLAVAGEEVGRREYRLATLVVPPSSPSSPTFEFAGAWFPVEPRPSKQVLTRRCLGGEGRIVVGATPSPGTVRLAASLKTEGSPGGGGWNVSSTCSPASVEVSGSELVWASFAAPATGPPPCEIRFTRPASAAHPLCVDVLAWRPDGP
jgi:hypothetical protein